MNKIRNFRKEDAPIISKLIRKTLKETNSRDYPPPVIKYMVKEFTPSFIRKIGKDRLFLVAEKNNHMVGTATLQDNYIGTVFILPEFQGQGIGTKLMNKVEKIAKNNGVKRVMLNASITAYKFYKKRGYRFKQTIRDENYGKTYKMEKEVD